ncbi:endonuclease domain-containing protein [Luedemannella flava]
MIVLSGLPAPQVQWEVYDAAGFVARVDLAYPEVRVAIEYDGLWHASADQLHHDRRRLNRLQAAGWLVIHVTASRLRDSPDAVLREITGHSRSVDGDAPTIGRLRVELGAPVSHVRPSPRQGPPRRAGCAR